MYGQPQQGGVSEAEIRGALEGTLDTAQGGQHGRLPANADNIVSFVALRVDKSQNTKVKTNGFLFAAFDVKVEQSSRPDVCPPGSNAGFVFAGLNSPMNNGSLAKSSQADMRRCLAALLGLNPEGAPPPIPQADGTLKKNSTWTDVLIFCKNNPHNLNGKKMRIVTGSPKGDFVPMQFFAVAG
jgi:hypothetical protein